MVLPRLVLCLWGLLVLVRAQDRNLDTFNYGETVVTDDYNSFGPKNWGRVRCPDLDKCLGYPDTWETGVGWRIEENSCRWCPETGNRCGTHHQSPIDLKREVALEGKAGNLANECIDVHWMSYFDSTCTYEELKRQNAFTVERHALKVTQPVEHMGNDKYRIGCRNELGRRWGKIDFSRGFSQWWHLSHIDFHVPSEHTQNGKRYDGEIQMYHFYSVTGEEAGVNNELAAVTMFIEAYDNAPDYDYLNKMICQWRRYEDETREACGLPSVEVDYPGCFHYTRGHNDNPITTVSMAAHHGGDRNLRANQNEEPPKKPLRPRPMSAHDIMVHNYKHGLVNKTHKPKLIIMDEEDYRSEEDFDWDSFIASQYENDEANQRHRHLVDYEHVGPFHNYFPMLGVRTEYYYRYSGSQTIPPCYGHFESGNNRAKTNNWRIMKDPIRISNRQLKELHRLLRERRAPVDAPLRACRRDTAAKQHPDDPKKVWVARPLQSNAIAHHKVFCECENWGSKWMEDIKWCRMRDKEQRFFTHPYNFETDGF